jgi:hypothetical protein
VHVGANLTRRLSARQTRRARQQFQKQKGRLAAVSPKSDCSFD